MKRARKMNPPNLHPNRNARWGYLERSYIQVPNFANKWFLGDLDNLKIIALMTHCNFNLILVDFQNLPKQAQFSIEDFRFSGSDFTTESETHNCVHRFKWVLFHRSCDTMRSQPKCGGNPDSCHLHSLLQVLLNKFVGICRQNPNLEFQWRN